jgi:hypothetical protein
MAKKSKHVVKFEERHANDGETVIAWGEGYIGEMMGKGDKTQHFGALIVTEFRVIFYRKGLLGEVLETMPLKSLTSIERKSTLGHRTIRLHASHDDLEFKSMDKAADAALVEAIENGRTYNSPAQTVASQADGLDKLKKLAALKESGVISEEEFNLKKEKLLAEI